MLLAKEGCIMPTGRDDGSGEKQAGLTGGSPRPTENPPPAGPAAAARKRTRPRPEGTPPPAVRLDDLYRLPMPKLFKLAEQEGIAEHTGMSRAQLIVGVVRRQIERGE